MPCFGESNSRSGRHAISTSRNTVGLSKMSRDSEKGKYTSPDGSGTWEYLATMSCALMVFCIGCIAGWSSPTLAILMKPDLPNPLTSSDASTLASLVALGHAIAPTLTVVMADKFGRRNSLLITGIPTIISWALIAVTQQVMVLFVARFIAGLALGLALCFPQMYLGEIASAKLRGMIGMVCGTMINTGILFMFVVVPYVSVGTTACICSGIITITVISIWFIPESPYFLAMVGKIDEAEGALEKLRGKTDVTEELELIKMTVSRKGLDTEDSNKENKPNSSALNRLLQVPGNRKALLINMLLQMAIYFNSNVIVMIYGQIIMKKMNSGIPDHICATIVASIQVAFNIPTVFVIDKLGRRPLLCISGVASGACLMVAAVYLYLVEYTNIDVTPYAIYATFAIFVNTIALNIGLMPLQHVIQSEVLDTQIKGLATCIIGVGGGIIATVNIKLYLMIAMTWNYGHSVPLFAYSVTTWIYTIFILKLLPETKGKTLLEIQKDLNA